MIRLYRKDDWRFVRAIWTRSYQRSTFSRAVGRSLYDLVQTRIIRGCVDDGTVLVACDETSPDTLWGFVCYRGTTAHAVVVAKEMRGNGVARDLLSGVDKKFDRASHEGWRGLPWVPQEAWR